jgi:predicted nucleic acid-binding protein
MLVLDTDHLVELDRGSSQGAALQRKLEDVGDAVATTIISAEEQFRGWLAQIHRQRDSYEQIATYQRLQRRIAFFAAWHVLPWGTEAADILLRRVRERRGAGRGAWYQIPHLMTQSPLAALLPPRAMCRDATNAQLSPCLSCLARPRYPALRLVAGRSGGVAAAR